MNMNFVCICDAAYCMHAGVCVYVLVRLACLSARVLLPVRKQNREKNRHLCMHNLSSKATGREQTGFLNCGHHSIFCLFVHSVVADVGLHKCWQQTERYSTQLAGFEIYACVQSVTPGAEPFNDHCFQCWTFQGPFQGPYACVQSVIASAGPLKDK